MLLYKWFSYIESHGASQRTWIYSMFAIPAALCGRTRVDIIGPQPCLASLWPKDAPNVEAGELPHSKVSEDKAVL